MSDITQSDEDSVHPFLSDKERALLKKGILKEFSEEDQEVFFHYVELTHLDPFTKQIYATSRGRGEDAEGQGQKQLVIVTGIGGLLWVAERTGTYDGDSPAEWCGEDGIWKDAWTNEVLPPVACRVSTYRKDRTHPSVSVVNWKAVVQYKRVFSNGKAEWVPTQFWRRGGPGQLAKCTLAASLRKLYASQLARVYIDEELDTEAIPIEQLDAKTEGINEAAHYAERAKISEKLMEAEKPNGSHANLVTHTDVRKEVKPEDMEDALHPREVKEESTSADWWKNHRVEVITTAPFKGKLVSALDGVAVEAAMEKWVVKVGLRQGIEAQVRKVLPKWEPAIDNSKQGEDFKLTAEAIALRFLDDLSKKAKEVLL